jgi:hypothetical protein
VCSNLTQSVCNNQQYWGILEFKDACFELSNGNNTSFIR